MDVLLQSSEDRYQCWWAIGSLFCFGFRETFRTCEEDLWFFYSSTAAQIVLMDIGLPGMSGIAAITDRLSEVHMFSRRAAMESESCRPSQRKRWRG